jgi:hypothetical protein
MPKDNYPILDSHMDTVHLKIFVNIPWPMLASNSSLTGSDSGFIFSVISGEIEEILSSCLGNKMEAYHPRGFLLSLGNLSSFSGKNYK